MTSPITSEKHFIDLIAGEVCLGINTAVRCWMADIERVLGSAASDADKLQAIRAIVDRSARNSLKQSRASA